MVEKAKGTRSGNPYHESAGTSKGGQFAHAPGSTKEGQEVIVKSAREAAGLRTGNLIEQLTNGGFSESLDGLSPTEGYMVALSKASEMTIPMDEITDAAIMDYVLKNYGSLNQPDAYLGGWSEQGIAYLDVGFNFKKLEIALTAARGAGQEGIYDIVNGETIYTKEAVK